MRTIHKHGRVGGMTLGFSFLSLVSSQAPELPSSPRHPDMYRCGAEAGRQREPGRQRLGARRDHAPPPARRTTPHASTASHHSASWDLPHGAAPTPDPSLAASRRMTLAPAPSQQRATSPSPSRPQRAGSHGASSQTHIQTIPKNGWSHRARAATCRPRSYAAVLSGAGGPSVVLRCLRSGW